MKKQMIKAFVALGVLLAVSANYVNAFGKPLIRKVEIPFDFSIGDKSFPAGVYNIASVNQEKVMLLLSSVDGRESIHIMTNHVQAKDTPKTSKLVFRRYGEAYFLAQVWESYDVNGRQLPKSRAEKSVERDLSRRGERAEVVDLVPSL